METKLKVLELKNRASKMTNKELVDNIQKLYIDFQELKSVIIPLVEMLEITEDVHEELTIELNNRTNYLKTK